MYIQPNDDSSTDGDHTKTNSNDMQYKSVLFDVTNSSSSCEHVEKSPDKCRFEEVEIKLEEMFAGIEDEQSIHVNNDGEQITNAVISKSSYETAIDMSAVKSTECILTRKGYKYNHPLDSKSSVDQSSRPLPEKQRDFNETNIGKSKLLVQNDNNSEANVKDVAMYTNIINKKNKSCGNSRKHLIETKKEIISKPKIKRKVISKPEEEGSTKLRRQKLKNRHSTNMSSSDNENESDERIQQTREDTKYRSPFVYIKNDGAISIINTATTDDFADKNNKFKKAGSYVPERKIVKGIYSSTLSNKYDADTADSTWICVFCKRGPHKKGLGDLFGPYAVSIDCEEYRIAANMNVENPTSDFQKHKIDRHVTSVEYSDMMSSPIRTVNTRQIIRERIMLQILHGYATLDGNYDDDPTSHQRCLLGTPRLSANNIEIWFHEDCAVWAPNLFLVGSRLVGLDSAIWNSIRHKCANCGRSGAIICCFQRDCKETAHLVCARENMWLLDESKLWAYCAKHA